MSFFQNKIKIIDVLWGTFEQYSNVPRRAMFKSTPRVNMKHNRLL